MLKEKLNTFPGWVGLDLSLSDEQLLVNGYSSKDATSFTDIFDGQESQASSSFYDYLPLNTCFFTYYGINDYELFSRKIKERCSNNNSSKTENFVKEHFAGEVITGFVNLYAALQQGNYVMLSIKDSTLTTEQLDVIAAKTVKYSPYSFQSINIYELPDRFRLTATFGDFASLQGREYVSVIGNRMLVASSPDLLTELSALVTSGYTLDKDNVFRAAKDNYDGNAVVLAYVHFPSLFKYAKEIFTASFAEKILTYQDKLSGMQALGWQMENERGRIYHNAFIKHSAAMDETDSVFIPKKKTRRLMWTVPFDAKPVFGPVIVKNKATGADEILLQDEDNKMYLYTHEGKLICSAQLDAPIMGNEMHQIDYYKNRKYQFVFNTAKKMYIIDRKGRPVEQYPVELPFEAAAPLSVFDYDNNMDYRIFIPGTDKKIYLYKKDGTMPSDWAFGTTKEKVSIPVQHIKAGNDD